MTPRRDESDGPWYTAPVVCRVCGHRHVAVWPDGCDEDNLECPNCGHMTAEPVEEMDADYLPVPGRPEPTVDWDAWLRALP